LGGALGDAIGARFEGAAREFHFAIPSELRITDDTQLSLATCESIVDCGTVNPEVVAAHFLRWFRERRITGIGSSTLKALTELEAGGHWALVGATGERAAGNGAAMRIAPLAFILDPDVDADRQTIRDVCRITHRHDEAYIGALAVLRTMRHVAAGNSLTANFLTILVESLPDSRVRDRFVDIRATLPTVAEYVNRFAASGYVVDSVPLAILAAIQSTDFLGTIEQLMHCGGDTDTNASIFGQIFGAAHGTKSLPTHEADRLDAAALIRAIAADLSRISGAK
jgi:ADP-ribosylglycohydrolase